MLTHIADSTLIISGGIVFVVFVMLTGFVRAFRKAGPHEALVVYGLGGKRVITGGGSIIWPLVETYRTLSLELMSFDVAPQQNLYTKQGVAVTVEAVAQIKVKSDKVSVETAAEQFLSKTPPQREGLIRLVMEGHLRGIIGQLTVEEIVKQPEMVADRMRSTCAEDMNKMGLEVISFTIKEVRDKNDYIANMGRPDVARIKMQADVAQAEAERDLEVKKAQYNETVKRQQAQADKAYEIQSQVMQQQVTTETVRVMQIEKEAQIKVQEAEISRHEKELIATVLKGAEIERARIEMLAAAERQRLISEAEGRASSVRVQGEAEAEIIFKKGEAEARAMNVKAEAYQEWNQAAVVDKLMTGMPEIVRALAAPLANIDKITIVSTGDGQTAGAHKLTGDMTAIAAQVPALFEALSGMQMSELLGKIRLIGDNTGQANKATKVVPTSPTLPVAQPKA